MIEEIVARTGIDEAMIETLVRTFYARVRQDSQIEANPTGVRAASDGPGS